MLIKKIGTVTTLLLFVGCTGVPKPPSCKNSDYAKRVNPEWVSDVNAYSVPWDNDKDHRKEKRDTIQSIKKRSSPSHKKRKPKKTRPITDTPANIITKMAKPSTGSTSKKNPILIQPASPIKLAPTLPNKKVIKKAKNKKGIPLPPKGPPSAEREALEQRMQEEKKVKQAMPLPKKNSPPSYLTPIKGPEEKPTTDASAHPPPVDLIQPREITKNVKTFVLHVGSYKNVNNALKQQQSLFKAGFPVYIQSVDINKVPYHRVFIGPDLLQKQAEAIKKELSTYMNVNIYSSKNTFTK